MSDLDLEGIMEMSKPPEIYMNSESRPYVHFLGDYFDLYQMIYLIEVYNNLDKKEVERRTRYERKHPRPIKARQIKPPPY